MSAALSTASPGPVLLDTHVLLWLMRGNERLSAHARESIRHAAARSEALVSAITPWEIAQLVSKKRLNLEKDVQLWIDEALKMPGIRLQPLLPAIAVESTRLPWAMHADPADRILVATARHLGATLLTADTLLLRYADQGLLRCQPASSFNRS